MLHELCNCTGFSYDELNVRSRKKELVFARQLVMVELMRAKVTEKEASGHFGLDHSTANHAKKIVRQLSEHKPIGWMSKMYNDFYLNHKSLYEWDMPFIYGSLIQ
jgi:chromosomal replication initiation ATPase DnaA